MSLIIDKQCVYKTIDAAREKEKHEQIPKKYLKLTCPLALLAKKENNDERIEFISTDEVSSHFDNFFPGKENLINVKSRNVLNDNTTHKKDNTTHKNNKLQIKKNHKNKTRKLKK